MNTGKRSPLLTARKRARESRLRAMFHRMPNNAHYYLVYNLRGHRRYVVSQHNGSWICHCEAGKAGVLCKHLARVLDREEKRNRVEALSDQQ